MQRKESFQKQRKDNEDRDSREEGRVKKKPRKRARPIVNQSIIKTHTENYFKEQTQMMRKKQSKDAGWKQRRIIHKTRN